MEQHDDTWNLSNLPSADELTQLDGSGLVRNSMTTAADASWAVGLTGDVSYRATLTEKSSVDPRHVASRIVVIPPAAVRVDG